MTWFDVDRLGLAKLVHRKGKAFILQELLQNAWDEKASIVNVSLKPLPRRPKARLIIDDDSPDGFKNLEHAYTLFAESAKKSDPAKRGRFNLGEKLVLALCDEATIVSTTGVRFDDQGRHTLRRRRESGTVFDAVIRITRQELEEVLEATEQLRPPSDMMTIVNGRALVADMPIAVIEAALPTETVDDDNNLRRTTRKTSVSILEPKLLVGWIYEMGIPIVETGDRFDIDIDQKVPLSMDRDSVTPSYLQTVRTIVLNATADRLSDQEASASWVSAAVGSDQATPDAVEAVMDLRFGERRVAFDMQDREANARAAAEGYTVVHGGSMSGEQWQRAKAVGAIAPAGKVFPSPKPYSDDPEADPESVILECDWSDAMQRVANFTRWAANIGISRNIEVRITRAGKSFAACYSDGELTFNVAKLGKRWFESGTEPIVDLIIHELAHEIEGNHLSEAYYRALSRIGARLFAAAAQAPELE